MKENFVKIIAEDKFKHKILKNFTSFKNNIANNRVIVMNKVEVDNDALSFINHNFSNSEEYKNVKSILDRELYNLELFSPGLGTLLLSWLILYYEKYPDDLFNVSSDNLHNFLINRLQYFDSNVYRPRKNDLKKLFNKIEDERVKEIISLITKKCDIEDVIYVEKSNRVEDVVIKSDNLFFKVDFDTQFLFKGSWESKDYNYIIIDGFVDSLSEIHHLLHIASENKEPYVIFCKGMREEVKNTISYNLMRGTINVMPICLDINEENVNILNDIAACHGSDIVSALKGDVISVSVKRELSKGKNIKVNKQGFYFSLIDKKSKNRQVTYLNNKINHLSYLDPNKNYLEKRVKNLNAKKITIYLGNTFKDRQSKNLDAYLRYLSMIKKGLVKSNNLSQTANRDIYSYDEIVIILKKFKSITKTLNSLGCSLVLE